jgi:hypothetical protein
MATKFTMGLKPIKVRIISIDGVEPLTPDTLTSIGLVAEGSTSINQEAPTETKYKSDYDDATIHIGVQSGDFILETDIVEISADTVTRLTGATIDGDTVSIPSSAPLIVAEVEIPFDLGMEKIHIFQGQLISNLVGDTLKTEMLKLHIKVVAQATNDGKYVDIVYPTDGAVAGKINTYSFVGGEDYLKDDILVVSQAGASGGTFLVTSVDGGGVILTMTKLTSGVGYTVANTLPTTTNSASGTGATISVLTVV